MSTGRSHQQASLLDMLAAHQTHHGFRAARAEESREISERGRPSFFYRFEHELHEL
jgi:hypothetical protein